MGDLVILTIKSIKQYLEDNDGTINVYSGKGNILKKTCKFKEPASEEKIELLEKSVGLSLPPDYKNFLRQCNGCSIFEDIDYDGEIYLYGLKEIEDAKKKFSNYVPKDWLIIGEAYEDLIIMDLERYKDNDNNYLLINDCYSSYKYAEKLNCNFEIWLDRIVATGGQKFWTWRYNDANHYYKL